MNVYPFVEAEQAGQRNVARACALLEVSRAAYYQWSRHEPSARARADAVLTQRSSASTTTPAAPPGRRGCSPSCAATASAPARGGSPA